MAQKDRLHFTNSGYQLVGDLMYNALIEQYIEHLKKNPIAY
jgi:lysophospholipase L1-like esterase